MWVLLCGWGIQLKRGYELLRNTISSNYVLYRYTGGIYTRNECDTYRKMQDLDYTCRLWNLKVNLNLHTLFGILYQVTYWYHFAHTAGALQYVSPPLVIPQCGVQITINLAVSICLEDSEYHTYIKTCTTKAIAATLSLLAHSSYIRTRGAWLWLTAWPPEVAAEPPLHIHFA